MVQTLKFCIGLISTFNVFQGNNLYLLHSNICYTAHFVSLMYGFSRVITLSCITIQKQVNILISKNQALQI